MGSAKGGVDRRCPLPLQTDPGRVRRETGFPSYVVNSTRQAARHKKLYGVEEGISRKAARWCERLPLAVRRDETRRGRRFAWVKGNVCVRPRNAVIRPVCREGDH